MKVRRHRVACLGVLLASSTVARLTLADEAAAAPSPESAQPDAVSEVVVTAQRRSERLSDVPIAVVAEDAAQLARSGVDNIRDLTQITPGLRMSGTGADAQPAIRGIHSDQTDPGNDPNVATYVDGVYQSNQIANNFDLGDIDRVEVLKGPQGTLFGRNATGGAIRIFTKGPSFTPAASVDLSYGNLNQFAAKVFAAGPLLRDVVAGSVSGYYETSDGYARDVLTGKDAGGIRSKALRGKLLIQPTDSLTVHLLGAYVYRFDGNATEYEAADGNSVGRLFPGTIIPTGSREFVANHRPVVESELYTGSMEVDWALPVGTLTSTSAYNQVKAFYIEDADFSSADLLNYPISEAQSDRSEELIFSSNKFGITRFTAGAFWYRSIGRYDPLVVNGSFANPALYGYSKQDTNAYAGFGEVNIEPVERLAVILGIRYSSEDRDAAGAYVLQPVSPEPLPPLGKKTTFNSVTPRASIRYTFPSGDNVYATYSQGFKSGGFNISGLTPTPFKPEKLDAYEIGLKTAPARVVSANFSAFYYNYRDQQVQASVNGFNVTANAASSHIYGADADLNWKPVDVFNLKAALSYLHARFAQYVGAVYNSPTLITPPGGGAAVPCLCGNTTTVGNLSGGAEPYSPNYTVGLVGDYHKDLAPGTVDFSLSWYKTARFYYDNNARVAQPSYDTLGGRVSFQPAGTHLTAYVWGKNLTNTLYINTAFIANTGDGITYAAPRTYGVGFSYKY